MPDSFPPVPTRGAWGCNPHKPFALVMTNTWLNDAAPKQLFKEKELQLMMFEKRMEFKQQDGRKKNKVTFSSSYYCWNLLPRQIIMSTF